MDNGSDGGQEPEADLHPTIRLIGSGPTWPDREVGVGPGNRGGPLLFLSLLFHLRPASADAHVTFGREVLNEAYDTVFSEPGEKSGRNTSRLLQPVRKAGMLYEGNILRLGVNDVDLWSVELRSRELIEMCGREWATIEDADRARTAWQRLDRTVRMAHGVPTIRYIDLYNPGLERIILDRLTTVRDGYFRAQRAYLKAGLALNRDAIDRWLDEGPPDAWVAAQRFLDGDAK